MGGREVTHWLSDDDARPGQVALAPARRGAAVAASNAKDAVAAQLEKVQKAVK